MTAIIACRVCIAYAAGKLFDLITSDRRALVCLKLKVLGVRYACKAREIRWKNKWRSSQIELQKTSVQRAEERLERSFDWSWSVIIWMKMKLWRFSAICEDVIELEGIWNSELKFTSLASVQLGPWFLGLIGLIAITCTSLVMLWLSVASSLTLLS